MSTTDTYRHKTAIKLHDKGTRFIDFNSDVCTSTIVARRRSSLGFALFVCASDKGSDGQLAQGITWTILLINNAGKIPGDSRYEWIDYLDYGAQVIP